MTEDKTSLKTLIAPCGLDCSRCVGFAHGKISGHAKQIADSLGNNFETYVSRLKGFNPAMEKYEEFRILLDALAAPSCSGCRSDNRTCLPACNVADCVKKQEVEFCFECGDFPGCGKTGLPDTLLSLWRKNNELMKEKGVNRFIELQSEKPRYP